MLLAIDVGNTNIVLGVFDYGWADPQLAAADAARTDLGRARLLVDGLIAYRGLQPVAGHWRHPSARPCRRWTATVWAMVKRYFDRDPLIVDPRKAGMPILYENPDEAGADRILNAIAAYEMFGRDARRPLVVCDFGTATTPTR